MKKITLLLLTVVALFSCQSEIEIEPEFDTYPDDINTRASLPDYELFNRFFFNYQPKVGYTWLVPLTQDEMGSVAYSGAFVFTFYPFMKRLTQSLLEKNITVNIGIDTRLTSQNGNGYYDPITNNIFFRKGFYIGHNDILHELLHVVQYRIIGYSMKSFDAVKNIEYEAFVARDILECIRKNGVFRDCLAMGIPNHELEKEYRLWIEKISAYVQGNMLGVEGVIEEKFNTWAEAWNYYTDKSYSKTFTPHLLRYIVQNINILN